MTVLAYRSGVLAADRQVSCGTRIDGAATKICMINGIMAGATGELAFNRRFLDWVRNGVPDKVPDCGDVEAGNSGVIILSDDTMIFLEREGLHTMELTHGFYAMGSGCGYAFGAMAMGARAIEAVQVAINLDMNCGRGITVLRRPPVQ